MDFATLDKLVYRIKRAIQKSQRISFLVGSGVTLPTAKHRGVPGTAHIVEIIRQRFADEEGRKMLDEALAGKTGAVAYQAAMSLLVQCEGQIALNEVIASAVLQACTTSKTTLCNDADFEQLENDLSAWDINEGVSALATLYAGHPSLIGPILTSNFDPLIGIAIKQRKAEVAIIPTIEDSRLPALPTSGPKRQVIHFHGYWRGSDTLHTTEQITKSRPRLTGELRKILEETTLVVLGYGGWPDVFMSALTDVIAEGGARTNVLWAFFEPEASQVQARYKDLLDKLGPQIGTRVIPYIGIDSNTALTRLSGSLLTESENKAADRSSSAGSATKTFVSSHFIDPGCDQPPARGYWTGRKTELSALFSETYKVAFITGIGGQGKSSLAAEFARTVVDSEDSIFWDWRDCREEANRMHTNLAGICYRLAEGDVAMEDLKEQTDQSLIEILFQLLGTKKAVFVFDNVDTYIDLRDLRPDRSVKTLVTWALSNEHNARFIFTCRPQIDFVATNFMHLPITGFAEDEAVQLFRQYRLSCPEAVLEEIAKRARGLTDGHPFWLNIIAAQASLGITHAESFMDAVEAGSAHEFANASDVLAAQTLGAVWQRLNDKQRLLLRGMSEAVCEQTEEELVAILQEQLNYNALHKSLKKLQQLNLIVTRRADKNSAASFDLHPLVRRFVRTKFTPEEQRPFVLLFIGYFDKLISRLKSRGVNTRSSFSDFSNWSHKIELELNSNRPDAALNTLYEVSSSLREAGYLEEYVRISELVYARVDWRVTIETSTKQFVREICNTADALIYLGRYDQADAHLARLESHIVSAGFAYLMLCDTRAFNYWHQDRFQDAIREGRRALDLKSRSGADVDVDVESHLALALRDSRVADNVREALGFFLNGAPLEDVIKNDVSAEKTHMGFYGNIGRCLQFLGERSDAVECYRKSLQVAEAKHQETSVIRNTGYAYWWIGEIFEAEGQFGVAAHFYKNAQAIWKRTCPPNARKMGILLERLLAADSAIAAIIDKSELEVASFCTARIARLPFEILAGC